jgi:hypothetical protein
LSRHQVAKAIAVPVSSLGNFGRMSDDEGLLPWNLNNFKDMYVTELQQLQLVECRKPAGRRIVAHGSEINPDAPAA